MKHVILDARHLLCPLPALRVQERVQNLDAGTVLHVVCTDPGVLSDIPAWCRLNGHRIMSTRTEDHEYIVELEVGIRQ